MLALDLFLTKQRVTKDRRDEPLYFKMWAERMEGVGLLESLAAWLEMSTYCADIWRRTTVPDVVRQEGRESQNLREARAQVDISTGRHENGVCRSGAQRSSDSMPPSLQLSPHRDLHAKAIFLHYSHPST